MSTKKLPVPNYLPYVLTDREVSRTYNVHIGEVRGLARTQKVQARLTDSGWLISAPSLLYVWGWPALPDTLNEEQLFKMIKRLGL